MNQREELSPGAELETVLLGTFCNGVLRIWRSNGDAEFRAVDDPELVASALGRGTLSRTSTQPTRFREVGLLDEPDGLLVLSERTSRMAGKRFALDGKTVRARLAGIAPPGPQDWESWGKWLGDIVGLAVKRSEYVVIETGGWEAVTEPYVLLGVFPDQAGDWISVAEALPAPATDPWPARADESRGSTLTAPAIDENVQAAGLLAIQAVTMWASSPFDVVLTFGRREPDYRMPAVDA